MVQVLLQHSVSRLVYYIIDGYGTKDVYSYSSYLFPYRNTAPTNEAFEKLDESVVAALLAEDPPNTLKGVLLYHVASGDVQSKDLSDGQVIETLKAEPNTVTVSIDDGIFIVTPKNQAKVILPDNLASNGVAHVIDAVLIPGDFEVPVAIDESV